MTNRLLRVALALALFGIVPAVRADFGRNSIHADVEVARVLEEIEAETAKAGRLKEEFAAQSERHQVAKAALKNRLRSLYRMTRAGRAPIGAGYDAIMQHVARVKRLKRIVRTHAQELSSLQGRTSALKAELGGAEATLQRNRERLQSLQESGAGRARANGFSNLMQAMPNDGYAAPEPTSNYGIRIVGDPAGGQFASMQGSLASPVSGEVRIADARRAESDGPGLEFQAAVGTAVRSAAAGRVAFADRYGSYGQLVILDHRDGYYTVYGGLGGVEVRVGDDLSRRARIGVIGSHGETPALFFEVRKGTRTLPARTWLGF